MIVSDELHSYSISDDTKRIKGNRGQQAVQAAVAGDRLSNGTDGVCLTLTRVSFVILSRYNQTNAIANKYVRFLTRYRVVHWLNQHLCNVPKIPGGLAPIRNNFLGSREH